MSSLGKAPSRSLHASNELRVVGLFAGIGGVELGMQKAGLRAELLCDIDSAAQRVLRTRFPDTEISSDVKMLRSIPKCDVLTAGFPCQDLSQAGRTAGIRGAQSGLISEVFRLLDVAKPRWLLLENVPFMLQLGRGAAMRHITHALESRGYHWAYRIVDSRAFGLPQRRQRVLMLASRKEDPRSVLFSDDASEPPIHNYDSDRIRHVRVPGKACGFYWTEGIRGLGWAVDAIPTLKGGSTLGIPSPPAILMPSNEIITPDIRDAERLQGFPARWTEPAVLDPEKRNGPRWKLVGNAVSIPVFAWIGHRLQNPSAYSGAEDLPYQHGEPWPHAAWNMGKGPRISGVSKWPVRKRRVSLADFLQHEGVPLSLRASLGFQARAQRSKLRFPEGFLEAVEDHIRMLQNNS